MYLIHVYSNANIKTLIYNGRKNFRLTVRSNWYFSTNQVEINPFLNCIYSTIDLTWSSFLNTTIPWKTNIACGMRFTNAILKGREPWLQYSHFTFFLPEKHERWNSSTVSNLQYLSPVRNPNCAWFSFLHHDFYFIATINIFVSRWKNTFWRLKSNKPS